MRYPHKKIVLQIGRDALDITDKIKILGLEVYLSFYEGLVDYVLFDPSGGKGKPFNIKEMVHCLNAAKECLKGVCLGVAGGLSAETLNNLQSIAWDFPDISIDAEGRLRNENDHLDINRAELYIKDAFEVLKEG